ncbi:MAG TPA: right-handed parallel beta-helix repeat-containing protein [Chthoniobacter sp.]
MRPLPVSSSRPLPAGPIYYVDAQHGDDAAKGTKESPWKTINASLPKLSAGDVLCLRGGSYFESVYCAVAGTAEHPITIRSYPGELAVIDGGLPEFQRSPATAWEPVLDGPADEYRSTHIYKNIRDVLGLFGDSNIGLQTYWYRRDLQAENETWIPNPSTFIEPMYCGPGLWYDKQTGRIHVRLAHTRLTLPPSSPCKLDPYAGETDPRKVPLVVAPYAAVPLFVDQAMHVHFEDLVFRGGGRAAVHLNFGVDLTFDHCTIYAGNVGLDAKGTGPLVMTNCGVFGMIAPWMWRTENALYSYSSKAYPPFIEGMISPEIAGVAQPKLKQNFRNIARLPTHAVVVTEGGYEFETFYHPFNHDWEISQCEFTEGHDGVYLSGRDIHFHHNLVDHMEDDGIYISAPTPYITDGIYCYQNLIRQAVDGFGADARGGPGGKIYLYRNVIDLRAPLQFERPSVARPQGAIVFPQSALLVHDSDHMLHMEDIYFYQNTTLTSVGHALGSYSAGTVFGFSPDAERRVFNNLFVYLGGLKQYPVPFGYKYAKGNLAFDGNLHWNANPNIKVPPDYFQKSRTHPLSEANKVNYPDGWDAHSLVGDPHLEKFSSDFHEAVDLRLQADSIARQVGVALPSGWPDPLPPKDGTSPDIGAFPFGAEPLRVGIEGRTVAGSVRQ